MTDIQTNGESTVATKPAEFTACAIETSAAATPENTIETTATCSSTISSIETATIAETTVSTIEPTAVSTPTSQIRPLKSCAPDRVRVATRRQTLSVDKYGDEHLSNQKKQRYWNSWEELFIVELWRRYRDEVTIINVPLPVYRKIMVAMRNRNMIVTAQDCRRKINTLNVRYKQELKRVETTGCKSDWKLFPLIHCVLQPKIKEYDPWHETKIITKLLDKLPKPVVEEKPPPPTPIITTHNSHHHQFLHTHHLPTPLNAGFHQPRSFPSAHHLHHTNITPQSNENLVANHVTPLTAAAAGQFEKPSILPFRNITMEKIEQLRQDNNRLAAQRDDDLKSLHLEENNFRCFETFIRIWTEQKELELRRVQLLTQPTNVLNMENGENHTMDQQLQETVVAK